MKVKNVLRFYYCADSLERTFDRLILKQAYSSAGRSCEECAEKICTLISEKSELSALWAYINEIISHLSAEVQSALERYARLRCGIKRLTAEETRALKRAVMAFTRRARRLESFESGLAIVGKYYCVTG